MSWRDEIRKFEVSENVRLLMDTQATILRIMDGFAKQIDESLDKEELNKIVRALIEQIEGQLEYLNEGGR
jgi:hypothetical protein|tara:strand:+ start:569 stop:778 length:210 start_codon:yes stop_codon:yes gene_type:complete